MEATNLIDELRNGGAEIHIVDDSYIEVTGNLTNPQREAIRAYKPELLSLLGRERRRQRVLHMMAEDDQPRKYYWATDDKAHPEFVFLTLAIRDVGTCEMSMPKEKYDPFLLMEILDKQTRSGVDS